MIFSIIFILLMIGVPIAMVVAVIVMLGKRKNTLNGLVSLAQSKGWEFNKSGDGHPLYGILENGVFSVRGGKHSLSNIIETGQGLWICDYQYLSPGAAGKRRASYNTLAVFERKNDGPDFWIIRKQNGPLGKIAEAVVGGQLYPVPGEKWSWLLTSSVEAFKESGWAGPVPNVLERRMVPGGSLFLTGKYLVLSKPGVLTEEKALQLKEDARMIRDLL